MEILCMENTNPFLYEKLNQILKKSEIEEHINLNETKSLTINPLKIKRSTLMKYLEKRGFELEMHDFTKYGIFLSNSNSKNPISATPEYLAGMYFLQACTSILPVINLSDSNENNKNNKKYKILDMCASPGGKTVLLGSIYKNSIIHANELNKERIMPLKYNIMRHNLTNCFITNLDGLSITKEIYGLYDKILLDAPCSGSGTLHKDFHAIKLTQHDLNKYVQLQKKLILQSFDLLKQNGIMVYSTCSVFVEENEWVVNYLLKNRKTAKIENLIEENSLESSKGKKGIKSFRGAHFHISMEACRRYSRNDGGDGFFVAKIKKH